MGKVINKEKSITENIIAMMWGFCEIICWIPKLQTIELSPRQGEEIN